MSIFASQQKGLMTPLVVLGVCSLIGCGTSSNPEGMLADLNDSNIKRVANVYAMFQFRNDYQGPKDEAALLAYLQGQDEGRLKRVGIDKSKLDELFISERDNQKFKIRWGVNTRVHAPPDPVVFEAEGVDGIRMVAFVGGDVMEADEQQFEKLWNGENVADLTPARPDGGRQRR